MRLSFNRMALLLVGLIAVSPVLAQFGQGGFGARPTDLAALLQNKSVQEELKLDEATVAKVKTITDGVREKFKEELEKLGKMDFKARFEIQGKIATASGEAITKEADKLLKPEQLKRLKQIQVQQLGLRVFTTDEYATALKLTDDQKTKVKGLVEDMTKDLTDARKEAGKDFKKIGELTTKITAAATDKASELLNDTQKTKLKELTGDKFELKLGGRPGGI